MSQKHRPPSRREQQTPTRTTTTVTATQITTVRLPDAQQLTEIKNLDPQLFEMIKTDFAANGEHRREIEKMNAETNRLFVDRVTGNDRFGLFASYSFSVLCVGFAAYFIATARPTGALLGVLGLLPSIIAAFRRGRAPRPRSD